MLAAESARGAIREMFLAHVIGGKHLSKRTDFTAMVRGATPDVVLTGVELLARGLDEARPGAGDVVVVDVGGATTDVHSVVELDPEDSGLAREVVATTAVTRTVEGDLGMRWSAVSTVEAAELRPRRALPSADATIPATCPTPTTSATSTRPSPAPRSGSPSSGTPAGARWCSAPRAGSSSAPARTCARSTCSSGPAARCATAPQGVVRRVLLPATGEHDGGWQLPRAPRVVVDHDYVLAAAGLLAGEHPEAAYRLVQGLARGVDE